MKVSVKVPLVNVGMQKETTRRNTRDAAWCGCLCICVGAAREPGRRERSLDPVRNLAIWILASTSGFVQPVQRNVQFTTNDGAGHEIVPTLSLSVSLSLSLSLSASERRRLAALPLTLPLSSFYNSSWTCGAARGPPRPSSPGVDPPSPQFTYDILTPGAGRGGAGEARDPDTCDAAEEPGN